MYEYKVPNTIIFYTDKFSNSLDYVPLEYEDIIPGYYFINPLSDIFSTSKNINMKQDINHAGYKRIGLMTPNGCKNFSVHRLVAYTFIINPYPGFYNDVNHIDGIKTNNRWDNLEWCTNNQNKHHASETGLYQHGEDRYNAVYTDEFAREICQMFANGIDYDTVYKYYQTIYPNTGSTIGSFIYKLYHRRTRKHITRDYNY